MIDTEKIALVLEFSIRGYLFGLGKASLKDFKKDLADLFPKNTSNLVDKQFDEIWERKQKEMMFEHD